MVLGVEAMQAAEGLRPMLMHMPMPGTSTILVAAIWRSWVEVGQGHQC